MEDIKLYVDKLKKYIKFADHNYELFQQTHDDDYMGLVDYYCDKQEECKAKLRELGFNPDEVYEEVYNG